MASLRRLLSIRLTVKAGELIGALSYNTAALLDDGLPDLLLVRAAGMEAVDTLISELRDPSNPDNRFTIYRRVPWLEVGEPDSGQRYLDLDGEPFTGSAKSLRFEVLRRRLPVILPPQAAPLLQQTNA